MQFQHDEAPGLEAPEVLGEEVDVALAQTPVRNDQKLGRNELCYCGSDDVSMSAMSAPSSTWAKASG